MNGAPGRCGEAYTVSESDITMMSRANDPRKHTGAITRIDCAAVLMAADNAALVDALDKVYPEVGGTLPNTEPRAGATASAAGPTLQ